MLTRYQVLQIPELRKSGLNNQQIAEKLGTTPSTIMRWVRDLRKRGEVIPPARKGRASILGSHENHEV